MNIAVIGNLEDTNYDIGQHIPETVTSIYFIRGQPVGDCAEHYADAHGIAKLGYPLRRPFLRRELDDAYKTLIDHSECVLILTRGFTQQYKLAVNYANRRGVQVILEKK